MDHLRTDHLEDDLAVRSARGSAARLAAQGTKFTIGIGATMVMARLLTPDDFGLVAIAIATVGMFALIKDAGLFSATVQSRHVTQDQATALFWMTAALAAAAAVLTLAAAPLVGWFYRDPRLIPITAALACIPLIDGLTLQLEAVMTRQMRLVPLSVMDTGALLAGTAAALVLAWTGAGYWALIWQELAYSAVYATAVWIVCRWRPGWRVRRQSGVRPMITFGLNLSGFRVLNYLAGNLDTIFVGRFRGPEQAGVYDRGYRVLKISSSLFNQPLSGVAIPTLSRLQGEVERYGLFYRSWIAVAFALTMPLVVFLFVDAERAVWTVLGAQWMGIVPIFRALAPAAFLGRINIVTNWLYITTGRPDRQLRWSGFLLAPLLVGYAVGVQWGAFGVAVAHSVVTCAFWYPGVVYCCRTAPVRPRDVLGVIMVPALASAAAGLGLLAVTPLLPAVGSVAGRFVLDFGVYLALYGAAWTLLPGGRQSLARFVILVREARDSRPAPGRRPVPAIGQG